MHPLTGKRALVTGAAGGIGRACAVALANEGADVIVTSRNTDQLADVADEIRELGRSAWLSGLDVRDVPRMRVELERLYAEGGVIDILVNNAGTSVHRSALETTEDDWDQVVETNLKGAFFCAQAVGRRMMTRGAGKIVNIASTFAVVGFPGRVAYAASKGGIVQMTRVLALEWARYGINVNAVGPAATLTSLNEHLFDDPAYRADVMSRIPAGRLCRPEDVAAAVVFLTSPASDMVHGHLLMVDGAWTAV
jgi:NAD(P)-dependent dehydrogenase (short-subunit alcohol dehydrogenase family)